MRIIYIPLFIAMFTLMGCKKNAQLTDEQEERAPLIQTGQAFMEQQQWNEAEKAFKDAINNNALIARPHLDLAVIYQQYKVNYIHAIYHYDRYLELRPDSEKAEFINDQKQKITKALANAFIGSSPQVSQLVAQRNQFAQENAQLKKQLASKQNGVSPQTATKTIPKKAIKTTGQTDRPASVSKTHQIYQVSSGDTLSKISTKFYGESGKWDLIFEANKDSMSSPSSLRVGQSLVIPGL